jgi:hypothetical protein
VRVISLWVQSPTLKHQKDVGNNTKIGQSVFFGQNLTAIKTFEMKDPTFMSI